jgi:hypothetical protein
MGLPCLFSGIFEAQLLAEQRDLAESVPNLVQCFPRTIVAKERH